MNPLATQLKNAGDRWIYDLIPAQATVLDLGCGDADLLHALRTGKDVRGRGVEIDENRVLSCLKKGIPVFQGNIEEGLKEHPDRSYDFAILNQTLQNIYHTEFLFTEMLRVGKKAVVSVPNFAHWKIRLSLGLNGRLPVTHLLDHEWYNTPNIRLVTVCDFKAVCRKMGFRILDEFYASGNLPLSAASRWFPNLFADTAIFLLESK